MREHMSYIHHYGLRGSKTVCCYFLCMMQETLCAELGIVARPLAGRSISKTRKKVAMSITCWTVKNNLRLLGFSFVEYGRASVVISGSMTPLGERVPFHGVLRFLVLWFALVLRMADCLGIHGTSVILDSTQMNGYCAFFLSPRRPPPAHTCRPLPSHWLLCVLLALSCHWLLCVLL